MKTTITTIILGVITLTILTGCANSNSNLSEKEKKDSYESALKFDENDLRNSEEYKNATNQEQQRMMIKLKIESAKNNVHRLR